MNVGRLRSRPQNESFLRLDRKMKLVATVTFIAIRKYYF